MAGYFAELHRRNVFRAAGTFLVGGWLLLQISTALEEAMELPPWFDTVIAAVLLVALPVVLVVSWIYELTPEGLQKTTDIDAEHSIAPKTGKRLDLITLAGVILVIGLIAYDRFGTPSSIESPAAVSTTVDSQEAAPTALVPDSEVQASDDAAAATALERSIAVLPFVAMSESREDEFFADGLSEELLNVLAKIDGLKVAGRTSSFYYKNKNQDLRQIAGALGVAHILEGSVRRSGETLRVTAQLIQADDGFHLWSETFDRSDGDTFAIQDEIASNVASALRAELIGQSGDQAKAPRNIEAQNLYLVAQAALAQRNLADVTRARDLFAKARAISPETPRYAAGYAQAVALMYWNFRAVSPDEAIYEASAAIAQALEADAPSADTLAIAGLVEELKVIAANDSGAKQRALKYYQQALEQDLGNVLAMQWLASIYLDTYNYGQSKAYFEKVVEIDPLNILALTGLASAQNALGETQAARNRLYKVQHLFPESGQAARYLSVLEFQRGRLDRSLYWGERSVHIDPNPSDIFGQVTSYLMMDDADSAVNQVPRLLRVNEGMDIGPLLRARLDGDYARVASEADRLFLRTGQGIFAQASAFANVMIGDFDQTIRILERQFPSLRGESAEYVDGTDIIPVVLLVHSYQQKGDTGSARRLADLLLESELLSEQSLSAIPNRRTVRAVLQAAVGDNAAAMAEMDRLRQQNVGLTFNPLGVRAEQYPVFAALAGEPQFQAFLKFERETLAEQAEALSTGATETEVTAEVEAAGFRVPQI